MAQKTLLKIAQTTAAELNLPQANVVISATDKNTKKMLSLIRSTCDVLLAEYDWELLQTRYAFTTIADQPDYPFPADLERFISGTFFDTSHRWELQGPLSPTGWEFLKASQVNSTPFQRFRIWGQQISLYPTPSSNDINLAFEYVSKNFVQDGSTGINKEDFTQDSDICLFDYRTVVFGTKYRWLASIGEDTTAALTDYKRAFEIAKGANTPTQRLSLIGSTLTTPLISSRNLPEGSWGY